MAAKVPITRSTTKRKSGSGENGKYSRVVTLFSGVTSSKNYVSLPFFLVAALVFAAIGTVILLSSFATNITLINESFGGSAAASNFTTVAGGSWTVTNGQYVLSNPASPPSVDLGNANYVIHKTSVTGDFTDSADFTVVKNPSSSYADASLIFNWKDASNYMYASFNQTANAYTNGLFTIVNGTQTRLVAFNRTFAPAVVYHAKVTRSGNSYVVTVDGAQVGGATSTAFSGGRLGLGSRNDSVSFDNFVVTAPPDTQVPSAPAGLVATKVTNNAVTLSWTASSDNVGVSAYVVYNGLNQVTSTTSTSYTVTGLAASTSYSFSVAAKDASGNLSAHSATVSVKTAGGFVHPGVLLDTTQLDLVKGKIAAGSNPWAAAFNTMKSSRYASTTYTPWTIPSVSPYKDAQGRLWVGCGAHNTLDEGCTQEMDDAIAAYTQALMWYYTGQKVYAQNSIKIMNKWSSQLYDHKFDTTTYTNGLLQSAWASEVFTRAGEIIRYTNAGWSAGDIGSFEALLNRAYLPHVMNGWKNGATNWLTSMADATMNIGVFTNNRSVFDSGVATWRSIVPSAIYLTTDGAMPAPSPGTTATLAATISHWDNPKTFVNGLEQETCRDMSHTVMGLDAMTNAAETAKIQGIDLYGEQKTRIVASYELNAKYLLANLNGQATPSGWPCTAAFNLAGSGYSLGWEVAYNEYAGRLGVAMPYTKQVIDKLRPTRAALHMDWETLTSGR